jgi:hypothetical protein
MSKHVVVMLPNGDWSVLPHRGKLEVAVVDDAAVEDLRKGADIRDIKAEAKFGLYFYGADANLAFDVFKEGI